mgnify:CR=1 FL=1
METLNKLTIIVPCYNETEIFITTNETLKQVLYTLISSSMISDKSNILYVDDGSTDGTWEQIVFASNEKNVNGLKLSRNCGHQTALLAGLRHADADMNISIDADLQDDVNVIRLMVEKFLNGADVVYGVREDRSTDSYIKRQTASIFYSLMSKMGVEQVNNHADFRLLSRRATEALLDFDESNIYIRGIIPKLGFNSDYVYYSRLKRTAGESKYPFSKMLSLAVQGITSNTTFPLRFIALTGLLISLVSLFAILIILIQKMMGHTVTGWASITVGQFFLGGVQMLSLGIIGEYVGKIYLETKKRPKYFVDKEI